MTDLATWLLDQIAADEHAARLAFGDHNDNGPEWTEIWSGAVELGPDSDEWPLATNDSAVSRFIAAHDPARVLRDCIALRAIVTLIEHEITPMEMSVELDRAVGPQTGPRVAESMLWHLVSIYSDRPGYLDEWVTT